MYRFGMNNAPDYMCDHFKTLSDVQFMVLEVMSTVTYMYLTSNERMLNSPCFTWVLFMLWTVYESNNLRNALYEMNNIQFNFDSVQVTYGLSMWPVYKLHLCVNNTFRWSQVRFLYSGLAVYRYVPWISHTMDDELSCHGCPRAMRVTIPVCVISCHTMYESPFCSISWTAKWQGMF